MGDDGRLRIPRSLVEHTLSICQRNLTLYGVDAKHDLAINGQRVHFSTAGCCSGMCQTQKITLTVILPLKICTIWRGLPIPVNTFICFNVCAY